MCKKGGVLTMENVTISLETVLWCLGFIVTTGGAVKVVHSWFKPIKRIKEDVSNKADKSELEKLRKEFETLKDYQNEDHDRLKILERGNEAICKCVLAITDHELTGNGQEQLKRAKEQMQNYLIEK